MDSDLELLQKALQTVTQGMSDKQLQWCPAGKWSVAEVLEHLYLTYTGTIKGLNRLLAGAKPLALAPSMKHRLQTFVVLGLNYLPSGRKAPPQTVPKGLPTERVTMEMLAKILAMDKILQECERRFGAGPLLDHPFLGPLTAKQWCRFHLIHGRHHVKQIMRLRQQMSKSGILPTPN
jgi:hypothetical protein